MNLLNRRRFIRNLTLAGGLALTGSRAVLANQGHSRRAGRIDPFRVSLSVSPFTERVLESAPLTDGDLVARTVQEVQLLFNRHGATEIYHRIGSRKSRPAGQRVPSGASGLERAALARSLDMPLNPEIGIFANYADVATYQEAPDFTDYPEIRLPGKWSSLTVDQMLPPLRQYGALVAREILSTGVRVNVWDIGNEVELGLAAVTPRPLNETDRYEAPDAIDPAIGRMEAKTLFAMPEPERIAWCQAHLWPHVSRILRAVADGIRSVDPSARFSSHISSASQRTSAFPIAFWEAMRMGGYLTDELGQSVWGTQAASHGGPDDTFTWLKDTATEFRRRFDRPMFLAEFGFPSAPMPKPFSWNDVQKAYPISEQGQHDYIRDVAEWGARTGNISGIRPWAPDYLTGPEWTNMSFFKRVGGMAVAKPALGAIREGVELARARKGVKQ